MTFLRTSNNDFIKNNGVFFQLAGNRHNEFTDESYYEHLPDEQYENVLGEQNDEVIRSNIDKSISTPDEHITLPRPRRLTDNNHHDVLKIFKNM